MKRTIAAIAALPLVLGACAGGSRLTSPYVEKDTELANYIGVQTATISCTGEDTKGLAFGSALAALGVEFAANLGKELLEDMQKNRTALYAASGLMDPDCLPPDGETEKSGQLTVLRGTKDKEGEPGKYAAFKLDASVELKRVGEGEDTRLQITVTPTFLSYGRAAPRAGGKRKRVIVMLQVSDKTPLSAGEPDSGLALDAPVRIDLGEVEEGRHYNDKMVQHAGSSVIMPFPKSGNPVVTALVVETEDESIALRAFSSAYDTKRDDLVAVVVAAINGKDDDASNADDDDSNNAD